MRTKPTCFDLIMFFKTGFRPLLTNPWMTFRSPHPLFFLVAPQKNHKLGSCVRRTICTTQSVCFQLFQQRAGGHRGNNSASLWKTMWTEVSSFYRQWASRRRLEFCCTLLYSSPTAENTFNTAHKIFLFFIFSLVAGMAQKWVINPKKYSEKKPDHI